ncbi:MAG: hypothetical protein U0T69_00235 [Chitinophagales bacterium]
MKASSKIYILLFGILYGKQICIAQSYQTWNYVKVRGVTKMIPTICPTNIDNGKAERTVKTKINGVDYNITEEIQLQNRTVNTQKTKAVYLNNIYGKANLYSDKDDKNILHVNFWLSKVKNNVSNGYYVNTIEKEYNCNGDISSRNPELHQLNEDTVFQFFKRVERNSYSENIAWIKYSTRIIEVYDSSKIAIVDPIHRIPIIKNDSVPDYYLVYIYEPDIDYVLDLENRKFISLRQVGLDFGPVTIPFKYRFGYNKDSININSEFDADLNVGFFGGLSVGRYRARYDKYSDGIKELSKIKFTVGAFINLSTAKLDSIGTRAGKLPFKEKEERTIAVLSPGLGVMGVFYNFSLGLFVGFDCGLGKNAKNWNFNNRPWLGIGLGYDISSFFKK